MSGTTYRIEYIDGQLETGIESLHEARRLAAERICLSGESPVVGHDGDLDDDGDRTLCWASAADAEGDDGQRAAAEIRVEEHIPDTAVEQ